jgi:4-carboxymuconolactone decarboxylase
MVAPSSRIADIPEAELSSSQSEVLRKLMAERGRVPTPFKIWLHSPALADHLHDLGNLLTRETSLSKREAKIAILLIAAHWRAVNVFTMQARVAREAGLPDVVIDAISAGDDWTHARDHTTARECAVYKVVRGLSSLEPVSDAVFDQAVAALGHPGLADLLAMCGYFTSVALAMNLYGVV